MQTKNDTCDFKSGTLPDCAPLASAYVPMQQSIIPKYSENDALTRGTLFPGLDLPFMNKTNKDNPYLGTPLGDIMALTFAIRELKLYLDTHKNDAEAFSALKEIIALYEKGYALFVKKYGPLKTTDLAAFDEYNWLSSPWPWEYQEKGGDK